MLVQVISSLRRRRCVWSVVGLLLFSSSMGAAFDPGVKLTVCDPYEAPLTGAGWRLPDARTRLNASRVNADAQTADGASQLIVVDRVRRPPLIEGRLLEPGWNTPIRVDGFKYFGDEDVEIGGDRTIVRFLCDDEALYVGVICGDARVPDFVASDEVIRRLLRDDELILTLGPEGDAPDVPLRYFRIPAFAAETLSARARLPEKNAPWEYAVAYDKGRWMAEIRISWWGLDPSPRFAETWRVNVTRIRSSEEAERPWTPFLPNARPLSPLVAAARKAGQSSAPEATGEPMASRRNSAWTPISGDEALARERMPRLKIAQDLSAHWWELRDIAVDCREGQRAHECRATLVNRTGQEREVIAVVIARSGQWKESTAREEMVIEAGKERRLNLSYACEEKGGHKLSLALVDKKSGRILRRTPFYGVWPSAQRDALKVRMTQNERAHASFFLDVDHDAKDMQIHVEDLYCGDWVIFGRSVLVRRVEVASAPVGWRLDPDGLRAVIPVNDLQADRLVPCAKPFPMTGNEPRQFWLTFDGRKLEPGFYSGGVRVTEGTSESLRIPLWVEVEAVNPAGTPRPVQGLWADWGDDPDWAAQAAQSLRALGFNAFGVRLKMGERGGFEWSGVESELIYLSREPDTEMTLGVPSQVFVNTAARSNLARALSELASNNTSASVGLSFDDAPFGAGLYDDYTFVREQLPAARTACAIRTLDDALLDSSLLLDDWYLGPGPVADMAGGGPLGAMLSDLKWKAYIAAHRPRNRFIILYPLRPQATPSEAAAAIRQAFWFAFVNGLDGVMARLDGPLALDLQKLPHEDAGAPDSAEEPGVSRLLEALADGAEDYRLFRWYAQHVAQRKADTKPTRADRANIERAARALDEVLALDITQYQQYLCESLREKLLDALLDEQALKARQKPASEDLKKASAKKK